LLAPADDLLPQVHGGAIGSHGGQSQGQQAAEGHHGQDKGNFERSWLKARPHASACFPESLARRPSRQDFSFGRAPILPLVWGSPAFPPISTSTAPWRHVAGMALPAGPAYTEYNGSRGSEAPPPPGSEAGETEVQEVMAPPTCGDRAASRILPDPRTPDRRSPSATTAISPRARGLSQRAAPLLCQVLLTKLPRQEDPRGWLKLCRGAARRAR